MPENTQNRNTIQPETRINATNVYLNLYLHPWNDARIGYYMYSLITATLIFENDNNESLKRIVNILNNQLTIEEQDYSLELTKRGLREGRL
ncbi:hypothetical protein [Weissella viridescens]|uniref:hypothetical protein n=1 Tax=Weissella viridescens TaxID=1629 RepID=UPI003AF1E9E3